MNQRIVTMPDGRQVSFHVSLSVRGALLWSDAEMRKALKWLTHDDGKQYGNIRELRAALMDALIGGNEHIPGAACDDFDPKTGCRGHKEE